MYPMKSPTYNSDYSSPARLSRSGGLRRNDTRASGL